MRDTLNEQKYQLSSIHKIIYIFIHNIHYVIPYIVCNNKIKYRFSQNSGIPIYSSHALELTSHPSPLLFRRGCRCASISNKISMALSRSVGDDAQPHWLIALRRGRGRIGLIRREVATAQSALSKLSIVGVAGFPAALSVCSRCSFAWPTDRKRLTDKFRPRPAASPRIDNIARCDVDLS